VFLNSVTKFIPMKNAVLLRVLLATLIVFGLTAASYSQFSPSGQINIKAPSVLSGCSRDTVFVEFTNSKGPSCPAPGAGGGNLSVEVDIPSLTDNSISYQTGSVASLPAGATFVSYAGKKLTMNIPVPSYGSTTKAWFVVQSTCAVTGISPLAQFGLKATYPAGFGTAPENWLSTKMNSGVAQINIVIGDPTYMNNIFGFNEATNQTFNIYNNGYGSVDQLKYSMIISDSLIGFYGGDYAFIYGNNVPYGSNSKLMSAYDDATYTSLGDGTHKVTFTLKGAVLDAVDGRFDNGDYLIFYNSYIKMPVTCVPDMIQKFWVEPICATGGPSCQKADTITKTFKVTAGVPIISGLYASVDTWNGCPDKNASFTFKNSGVPSATNPEVGTAYDVDLSVSLGGSMQISNLLFGGVGTVPTTQALPGVANAINWKIKNQLTTDPDGAGKGLEDLDGDGFFDDIRPGDSVLVSWKWAVPCDLACGKSMNYDMKAVSSFTDYCRKLNGSGSVPMYKFGFEQTAPIAQKTPLPDYGTMGNKALNTKTGRFGFNYKQNNVNLSAATVKLRINYAKDMEIVEPISFLGVTRSLSDFTVVGTGFTPAAGTTAGAYTDTTANTTDMDSALVYTLTNAEMLSLFDNVGDSLVYSMTHISCSKFQNTTAKNSWQLIFQISPVNCPTTNAPPCGFDLACNQGFGYQINEGCGVKPCYIVKDSLFRTSKIGTASVAQTGGPLLTAPTDFYTGDTLTKRFTAQLNADYPQMEPIGSFEKGYDMRNYFGLSYNRTPGTPLNVQPLLFLENVSRIYVVNTITGDTIANAPLRLKDFLSISPYGGATKQKANATLDVYDNIGPSDLTYGSFGGLNAYYCNYGSWPIDAPSCPYKTERYYLREGGSPIYLASVNNKDGLDTRITESYYFSYENALKDAGYNFEPGYAKYKYIVDEKWYVNPDYPHTNTGQFVFRGGMDRYANTIYDIPGTYMGSCGEAQAIGTITTKVLSIVNPGATYNSTCGLTIKNELYLKGATGDVFSGGEVRVPYKLDKITINLPVEYEVTAGNTYTYHQNGMVNTGTATNAGVTNLVTFTGTGTNGEFPRMDDKAGNNIVHSLSFAIDNIGTDNTITNNYRVPVKYYLRDEFEKPFIIVDTINIVEGVGAVTVSALGGIVQVADAGACGKPYMDLLVANNTLYTAGHALLNIVGTANSNVISVEDRGTPLDPLTAGDTGTVSPNRKYALLGAIAPAEQRILRVYFNTTVCEDSIKVITNFGCNYPAGNDIYANSTTKDSAYIKFKSVDPKMLVGAITPKLNVVSLCDVVEVVVEVANVKNPNLFNISAGFKLPANMKYVAGSMKSNSTNYPGYAPYDAAVTTGLVSSGLAGDSMVLNVSTQLLANGPLGNASSGFFFPGCGLAGPNDLSTAAAYNGISYPNFLPVHRVRIKFMAEFMACPTGASEQISVSTNATNYCGTVTTSKAVVNVIYVGATAAPNNYSCSTSVAKQLPICAKPGETQTITDTLVIKNEGGNTLSGPSSATDSLIITVPIDTMNFTLKNFVVNGTPLMLQLNAEGKYVLRTTVPAGIAVGATYNMPFKYDLLPKVNGLCGLAPSLTCPELAFFTEFKAVISLSCPAKGITCPALATVSRGRGISVRDIVCCASLGNKVWLDEGAGGGTAKDGIQNGTEPGVAGVPVMLYTNGADGLPGTDDDVLVGSTITDAYGIYLFDNLYPTDQTSATTIAQTSYNVRVTPPANYSLTTQTNTADDNNTTGTSTTGSDVNVLGVSYSINLSNGENNPNIDAGLIIKTPVMPNSIGDKVWFDANGDGVNANSATEPGVAGVTVTLYDAATGNVVAVTTTDANGNYIFNNLPPNTNYTVGFSAPGGTVLTTGGTLDIANGSTNSDANPLTGLTAVINTGAPGTQITGVDAGLKNDPKGALGDFVWNDLNNNGIQDPGEPAVPGVTMKLYGPGPDGVIGGADDVLLATTVTDANGYYIFPNLDPGKYFVVATPVAGYTNSPKDVGTNNTKDSDFGTGTGPYAGSYVSGLATLLNTAAGVTRDMTVDLGIHNNTPNLNSIGNKVWNDVNKDGIQDASEAGVANVTVRLLNGAGMPVNNPATGKPYVVQTDANGNYKFVDLPDGNYIVEFANLPVGFVFTTKDAAGSGAPGSATDTDTDSDANTGTGRTGVIDLDAAGSNGASVNILTVDAGITQGIPAGTASLGNRVWYDVDNDGLQDAGEYGVAGVKCELLDGNGNVVNVPGTSIPYVIYTNALGEYLFTGLPAGDYKVRFSHLPAGYTSSPADAGANDAIDSDANFAGISSGATIATTGVYSLQTGEDNLTVDMGIVPPATGNNNSLGNFVWNDLDADGQQDAGEPGVQGVTVTLYNNGPDGLPGTSDDMVVGVTTTDNNGGYSFVGLADGNYNVKFTNLPAGFTFTDKDAAGSTGANGSDASKESGRTGTIALDPTGASSAGINDPNVDAGIITTRAALGNYVWLDTNGDGVQDASEKGISGVTVILYAADGVTVVASTVTDADGKYYFGNLIPGTYVVGFSTLPSNLSFTTQNMPGDNANNTNSDANPITGLTAPVTLVAGQTNLTVDAGLKPTEYASVGNLVWNDKNNDGVQGADEPGIPGILVTLYDATTNLPVGTAITDGNGNYLISKIPVANAGTSFYIVFGNLPATATFTTQTSNVTAADGTLGSDANSATGQTATFTLVPGQYLPTVDAGIINVQVLPIKIASFTAVPKESQVALQWIVSEQTNVTNYEVLYSTDGGRTFTTTVATVASNGNQSATYDAMHATPAAGVNFYRIKTIEKDGTVSYSEIRKVTFGKAGAVVIFPNPAPGKTINISLTRSMTGKAATVTIVTMEGKVVSVNNLTATNQTETINISNLASGSYIVRIATNNEVVNTKLEVIR
jgi:protocatechuate 3,4-dioxygenase beta subunit